MKRLLFGVFLFSYLFAVPTIGEFYFDGVTPAAGETISNKPVITVEVSGPGIIVSNFRFFIDGTDVLTTPQNYSYDAVNGIFEYVVVQPLIRGTHTFEIIANDGADSQKNTAAFVASSEFSLRDKPIAYPSPATKSVTIGYELTASDDLEFLIYSVQGEMVYRRSFPAGAEGAHAGYNAVVYDLKKPNREPVPNGVYVCMLVSKENGKRKVLDKTKFFVLR